MSSIDELTEYFRKFPGIGPRQAKRFAYYILKRDHAYVNGLIEKVKELKQEAKVCDMCYRYHTGKEITCNICSNVNRENDTLLVVALDTDLETIEKSNTYHGQYFILGGNIPLVNKYNVKVRIEELKDRIEKGEFKEIIIALSANPEGENTTDYVKTNIKDICEKKKVKASILGRGLSTGTEIEYSDPETIKNALGNRV